MRADACALAHQRDTRNGNDQDDTEQGKAVGAAHDCCLLTDRIADRDNGLVPFSPDAGDPMRQGVLLQVSAEKLR
jgi:hypothetical protein